MKAWKKILALLMALMMVLSMVACEKDDEDDKDDKKSSSSKDKDEDKDDEDEDKDKDDNEDPDASDPSDPSDPSTPASSAPATQPTVPVTQPTTPAPQPTTPAPQPTTPAPQPTVPSTPTIPDEPDVPGDSTSDAEAAVAEYVRVNGDAFMESFTQGFTSGGMTCETDIEAYGTGILMAVFINELDNCTDAQKAQMQASYDAQTATWDYLMQAFQAEEPAITYYVIYICEKDGDILAVISAGDVPTE